MNPPVPFRHLKAFRWYRRSKLWVAPVVGIFIALVFAVATLALDQRVISLGDAPFMIFRGTPDSARTILSLIATSMATLTALVLTIIAIIIQLATNSLSPRAVRTFLQDFHTHLILGSFVSTFTYALLVLQQFDLIRGEENGIFASSSVTLAFLLAVFSLVLFIFYVDHIVHQARVTNIISGIGAETRSVIEEEFPLPEHAPEVITGEIPGRKPDCVIYSKRNGVILEIDVAKLMEEISHRNLLVVMLPAVGDFIPTGSRLLELYGDCDVDLKELLATVDIDAERSIMQDASFGFRLLVDVAVRALSPGMNDPTTATQVVDQLHDLLMLLGSRRFPNGWHVDNQGTPRLFVPQPSWDIYVALAFEEIRHHGAGSLQVVRRIRSAVDNLFLDLPEDRHPPLKRQRALLDEAAAQAFPSAAERRAAGYADAQGIGSGGGFGQADVERTD
jgi:uncharacterized membrane protein